MAVTPGIASFTNIATEAAAAECISDEALANLRLYKYSSVDKSPVSKYILGPWVNIAL